MSEFSHGFPAAKNKAEDARIEWMAAQAVSDYLTKISGDFSGSNLPDYLSDKDVDNCRDFLGEAEQRNFPNALAIDLQKRKYSDRLVWKNPNNFTRIHHPDLFMKSTWNGKGYFIGELPLAVGSCHLVLSPLKDLDNQQIGELRCRRSPDVFVRSFGKGYGVLPVLPPAETPIKIPNLAKTLIKYLTS